MLKEWVLIAMLTTGEPVQDVMSGEDCHALYDAIEDGYTVTKDVNGEPVALRFASCIPLDVFNSVTTEKPE